MALVGCFPFISGKKKRSKESRRAVDIKKVNGNVNLRVKPEEPVSPSIGKDTKEAFFEVSAPYGTQETISPRNGKAVRKEIGDENTPEAAAAVEAAYEGGDEHDELSSMKRDFSDFDLQARAAESVEINPHGSFGSNLELNKSDHDDGTTPEAVIQSGHVSDPGIIGRTAAVRGSPTLKRSCSNIETKRSSTMLDSSVRAQSYEDLQNLPGNAGWDSVNGGKRSPLSVASSCSADRVMLKKRSSSQVLPSRSRKLWWRLFLWSHRNLHRPWVPTPQRLVSVVDASNQKGGYSSDTLEPSHADGKRNKKVMEEHASSHNQWVAFSAESSSLGRVNAWVNSLDDNPFTPLDGDDDNGDGEEAGATATPNPRDIGESSGKNQAHMGRRSAEEVAQANIIIQTLNTLSSVAHIAGMGLKVIPPISAFTSLRSVNLSGNFIVRITPGSLPKGLHSLDLSRNKISTLDGLRELTRLRVLNLSYNRISRIGHGLSNCTIIKELYLAGNKISDVEGLHRLLKLTVLDLSFNKITTTKALGQLVANYNSLLALNLLGNPIQSNIGDDPLRKAVSGLLPQLAYFNKQPIKPQRAREVATDSVAKAALGDNGWSSRRRLVRRVSQSSGSSSKARSGEGSSSHKGAGGGGGAGGRSSTHRSSRHHHSVAARK